MSLSTWHGLHSPSTKLSLHRTSLDEHALRYKMSTFSDGDLEVKAVLDILVLVNFETIRPNLNRMLRPVRGKSNLRCEKHCPLGLRSCVGQNWFTGLNLHFFFNL